MKRGIAVILMLFITLCFCACNRLEPTVLRTADGSPANPVSSPADLKPEETASPERSPAPVPPPLLEIGEDAWWLNTDADPGKSAASVPVVLDDIYGFSPVFEWQDPRTLDGLSDPRGLCSFYPSMLAFIATGADGTEGIYAGQGLTDVKELYAPEPGLHLAGVSGSEYALYWAEYDEDGAWRVMLQRFDEDASPELLKSGEGAALPPVFHDGCMLLTENIDGVLTSRLLVLDMVQDHPMEHRPPIWMDIPYRLSVQDFFAASMAGKDIPVSVLYESKVGPVAHGLAAWAGSALIIGDAPVACHKENEKTVWLTQTGKLFLHERRSENTFLLAEGVAWFHVADSDILYADQLGARLCVAQVLRNSPEGLDPHALHAWRTAVVLPAEEGVTYLMAAHGYYENLALTLMAERDGVPFLRLLNIGTINE